MVINASKICPYGVKVVVRGRKHGCTKSPIFGTVDRPHSVTPKGLMEKLEKIVGGTERARFDSGHVGAEV